MGGSYSGPMCPLSEKCRYIIAAHQANWQVTVIGQMDLPCVFWKVQVCVGSRHLPSPEPPAQSSGQLHRDGWCGAEWAHGNIHTGIQVGWSFRAIYILSQLLIPYFFPFFFLYVFSWFNKQWDHLVYEPLCSVTFGQHTSWCSWRLCGR